MLKLLVVLVVALVSIAEVVVVIADPLGFVEIGAALKNVVVIGEIFVVVLLLTILFVRMVVLLLLIIVALLLVFGLQSSLFANISYLYRNNRRFC